MTPNLIRRVRSAVLKSYANFSRPAAARAAARQDADSLPSTDPGIDAVEEAGFAWLAAAQDQSATGDSGIARHYSVVDGWAPSYPETSGYIVPTLLWGAARRGDGELEKRARRVLDWLVAIQLPGGGFQGGVIGATPVVPVTFNTGQILIGLADGARKFGDAYTPAMHAAAKWLVETQDPDGCWRNNPSPFAAPGEKVYETHVAWGLFEAARVSGSAAYREAAERNVRWALRAQRPNGWFERCCLDDPSQPLTHTLGYVLRGILEAFLHTGDAAFRDASRRTADGLLGALRPDGFLPGRLGPDWNARVPWACLTGSVQIAYCWLVLFEHTGEIRYRDAAFAANSYVRKTVVVTGPPEIRGAVKGSFPIDGGYGQFEFLNWACKFMLDANALERRVRDSA